MQRKKRSIKKNIKNKKNKRNKQKTYTGKRKLKNDDFSYVNNLNFLWSKKFKELKARSQAALDKLKKNQESEYQKLFSQYQEDQTDV